MTQHNNGLHHVAMNVSDIDRSIDFYQRALGFKLIREWTLGIRTAMLDMGDGTILEMFERPEAPKQEGTLLHIALRTSDVDASYAHALDAGAKPDVTPQDIDVEAAEPYPIRIAFVKGPDGEPIEFFHERG